MKHLTKILIFILLILLGNLIGILIGLTCSNIKPIPYHREVITIEDTGIRDEVDILIENTFANRYIFVQ